jgi:hypothetical protein
LLVVCWLLFVGCLLVVVYSTVKTGIRTYGIIVLSGISLVILGPTLFHTRHCYKAFPV